MSGLPPIIAEPTATALEVLKLMNGAGLPALAARLRRQRAHPRFDSTLLVPFEVELGLLTAPGTRTTGARQRRPSFETWVAVPAALRDASAAPTEAQARIGLYAYLVVYRREPESWCIWALMGARTAAKAERRREEAAPFVVPWAIAVPQRTSLASLGLAAAMTSACARAIKPNAVWLQVGSKVFEPDELGLVLGEHLSRAGMLRRDEEEKLRRTRSWWVQARALDLELKSRGALDVDAATLDEVAGALTRRLQHFNDPMPGSLKTYVDTAVKRAGWRAKRQREATSDASWTDDDASDE